MKFIEPRKAKKNGRDYWRVSIPITRDDPRQRSRWFASRADADRFAERLNQARIVKIEALIALPVTDQMLMAQALARAGSAQGVFDCVILQSNTLALEKKPLTSIVRECANAKAAAGCRPAYVTPFELMLDRFAKHCGQTKLMNEITLSDVESFVNAPKMIVKGKERVPAGRPAQWTRRARWIDIRTLFSFAIKRGYCRVNVAEKIEQIRLDTKPPAILRPNEARDLLHSVRERYPKLIPYIALCMFGGLRPSEARQIRWQDIRETIHVGSDISKGRRRRLVTVNETLRAWLNLGGDLPVLETVARKARKLIADWPRNGLRHSFVSYHFARYGGRSTASEAGHSEDILHAHYRELVTAKAADEFWALRP